MIKELVVQRPRLLFGNGSPNSFGESRAVNRSAQPLLLRADIDIVRSAAEDDAMRAIVRQLADLARIDEERRGYNLKIEKRAVQVDRLMNLGRCVKDRVALLFKLDQRLVLIRLRLAMQRKTEIGQPDQLRLAGVPALHVFAGLELEEQRVTVRRAGGAVFGVLLWPLARILRRVRRKIAVSVYQFVRQNEAV